MALRLFFSKLSHVLKWKNKYLLRNHGRPEKTSSFSVYLTIYWVVRRDFLYEHRTSSARFFQEQLYRVPLKKTEFCYCHFGLEIFSDRPLFLNSNHRSHKEPKVLQYNHNDLQKSTKENPLDGFSLFKSQPNQRQPQKRSNALPVQRDSSYLRQLSVVVES